MKKKTENISAESVAKKEKAKKTYASSRVFKHGGIAVILTALFIVAVVLLNIGGTLLAKNVSMTVDLTANRDFTISKKNKDYIKDIKRDVNIVVCCDEDTYKDMFYQYAYSAGYLDQSGSYQGLEQFFVQNAHLISEYDKLSKHISVEYADPQKPEFSKYTNKYPNVTLSIGDILVESDFTVDGEKVNRYRVLGLEDIFSLDEEMSATYYSYYGQSVNIVGGNNIETALTSAIATVTADRSFKVALITANGGTSIDSLQGYMEMNNFEFTNISSLLNTDIPGDTDLVIVSCPTYDYSEEELKKLDKYLELKSGRRNTLMYVASADQTDLPNLNEFMSEWGFSVVPQSTVMETSAEKCLSSNPSYVLMSTVSENGYTDNLSRDNYSFVATKNVPIIKKDTTDLNVTTVLQISDSAIAVPNDAPDDFKKEDAKHTGPFVGVGVSYRSQFDSDNELMTSSVIAVSSADLINTLYNQFAEVGNIELLSVTVDKAINKSSVGVSFEPRTFTTSTFTPPSNAKSIVMQIIFIYVLPVAVLACGVVIFIRRRRS